MATNDIKALDWDERFKRVAREWWPVPVFVAGGLLAQQVLLSSRYDVGGHVAEHLASASAPFMAAAVLAILLWATPRARRQIDVLVAAAVWFTTTVVGDAREPSCDRRPCRRGLLAHTDGLRA